MAEHADSPWTGSSDSLPLRFRVLRPADLLVLDVTAHNLHLSGDGRSLVRGDADDPAFLVVALPSQHVAERAFVAFSNTREETGPLPFAACAAGPTRLVFSLPDHVDALPCNVAGLLDWAALEPRLAPHALPAGTTGGPHPTATPAGDVTAIELPWRLLLSPDAGGHWRHRHEPFANGGRVELWHTTLSTGEGAAAHVRALARRPVGDLVRGSLSEQDLADLVTLTSDFRLSPRGFRELRLPLHLWSGFMDLARLRGYHYPPRPLRADRLTLTALGGSARLEGAWDYPPPDRDPQHLRTLGMPTPTLAAYDHVVGLGRDQLVRVVRRGFLSTGHRASILKVTERQVEPRQLRVEDRGQGPVPIYGGDGVLRQWFTIVVTEPTVDYGRLAGGYTRSGREMPLRTLTCATLVTPRIDLPEALSVLEGRARVLFFRTRGREPRDEDELAPFVQRQLDNYLRTPFWVRAAGRDVELTFDGTDWTRRPVTLTSPVVFVPEEAVGSTTTIRNMVNGDGRRRRPLHGQTVALADPAGGDAGATSVPIDTLTFTLAAVPSGREAALPDTYRPRWVLAVAEAGVHVEAVERLTGHPAVRTVRLHETYLTGGLHQAANPAGVFAALTVPESLAFSGPAAGGLARPDSRVELLSSRQGAMAGAFAKPAVTTAELASLFGTARLFGTVHLVDVLADPPALTPGDYGVADLPEAALDALIADPHRRIPVPVVRTRRVPSDAATEAVETRFLWKPPLRSHAPLAFDTASTLVLDARTLTPLDGGEARAEVRGELRHVTLRFAGVVEVTIDRLAFTSAAGRKPDLTAEGFVLRFTGPLAFVDKLKDVLPADGFSDPPAVTVGPDGVTAGYSLGIPTVGVGVFSLQNLTVAASLAIPFVDRPAGMRFAVSERHQPFLVTLSLFGGGGFFALEASARRIEAVEAAIEFGASVTLNLGVASGGVSVMAGIYFGLTGDEVTLTGYLRCSGYLSVLGLISISVEFYLAFTWRDKGGGRSEVWGQARVTVCVEVACFSKSVSLSLERRFAGAGGDPTFADCVEPDDFLAYCLAFAEE
jgi:hypothetical protein